MHIKCISNRKKVPFAKTETICKKVTLRTSLFWDVTQRLLGITFQRSEVISYKAVGASNHARNTFILNTILPAALWSWGRLSLQQKWVPGIFHVGKGGRCVVLTTLPPLCADCLKSWNPQYLSRNCSTCLCIYGFHNILQYTDIIFPKPHYPISVWNAECKCLLRCRRWPLHII